MNSKIKAKQEQFYSLFKASGIAPIQSRILALELQEQNVVNVENVTFDQTKNRFKIQTNKGLFSITKQNVDLPFVDLHQH